MIKNTYMTEALTLAKQAMDMGEVPVGAVMTDSTDQILTRTYNLVETKQDPTAHAELLAIQHTCQQLGTKNLSHCDIYVTLEPCAMCAQALAHARIRRIYFGAYDEKGGGIEHGARIFHQTTCHHKPEIYGGILEKECRELLKHFFHVQRYSHWK